MRISWQIRDRHIDNPYEPPSLPSPSVKPDRQLLLRHHIFRNFLSWLLCLAGYCALDYFYVHHGPQTVSWAESLLLPVYLGAIVFANRGLFPNNRDRVSRWIGICGVSFVVALVGGCAIITLGVWFHFFIGGTL